MMRHLRLLVLILLCRVSEASSNNTTSWSDYFSFSSQATTTPASTNNNATTSWYDYLSNFWGPPQVVEETLEVMRNQVSQDITFVENKLEQAREQIESDVEQMQAQFLANMAYIQQDVDGLRKAANRNIRQARRDLDKRIRKHIFQQRVGWDLIAHVFLNHLGFVFGTAVTMHGYKSDRLARGATALQVRLLSWQVVEISTNLPHADVIATILGFASLKFASKQFSNVLSPLFLTLSVFQTMSRVLDDEEDNNDVVTDDEGQSHFAGKATFATALSMVGLKVKRVPYTLAAASLSGSALMCESVVATIASNGYLMARHLRWVLSKTLKPLVYRLLSVASRVGSKYAYRRVVQDFFGWEIVEETQHRVRQAILKLGESLWKGWRAVQSYQSKVQSAVQSKLSELYGAKSVLRLTSWLQRQANQHRRDILPWAMAGVGVARQMGWVNGVMEFRKLFMNVLNPGKTLLDRVDISSQLKFGALRKSTKRILAWTQQKSAKPRSQQS